MNLRTARVVVGLRVCVRLPWNIFFKLIKTITVLAANIHQLGILNGHVPMRLIQNVPGLVLNYLIALSKQTATAHFKLLDLKCVKYIISCQSD